MSTEYRTQQFTAPGIQLDPHIYTVDSEALMRQRGILREDETMQDALGRVTGALLAMDEELTSNTDPVFANRVVELVNKGVIVYGTPVLTNAGREREITAACTVLPVRVKGGKVDVKRFAADSYAALDKAVGTGYDLSEVEHPAEALVELNQSLDQINTNLAYGFAR